MEKFFVQDAPLHRSHFQVKFDLAKVKPQKKYILSKNIAHHYLYSESIRHLIKVILPEMKLKLSFSSLKFCSVFRDDFIVLNRKTKSKTVYKQKDVCCVETDEERLIYNGHIGKKQSTWS